VDIRDEAEFAVQAGYVERKRSTEEPLLSAVRLHDRKEFRDDPRGSQPLIRREKQSRAVETRSTSGLHL